MVWSTCICGGERDLVRASVGKKLEDIIAVDDANGEFELLSNNCQHKRRSAEGDRKTLTSRIPILEEVMVYDAG